MCERDTIKILNCRQNRISLSTPRELPPYAWRHKTVSSSELWSVREANRNFREPQFAQWQLPSPVMKSQAAWELAAMNWQQLGFVKESPQDERTSRWEWVGAGGMPWAHHWALLGCLWGVTPLWEATILTIPVAHTGRLVHVPTCRVERPHSTREIGWGAEEHHPDNESKLP